MKRFVPPKLKIDAGAVEDFMVNAISVMVGKRLLGWRVTSTDQHSGLKHEFYVSEGRIHHILLQSLAHRGEQLPFVVGARVKRMLESEKHAILKKVAGLLIA